MEKTNELLKKTWQKHAAIDNDVLGATGYVYCENEKQKDILITGINPSLRKDDNSNSYGYKFEDASGIYWNPIKKILKSESNKLDYTHQAAYTDLFYFRRTDQKDLTKRILKHPDGISFLVDQLRITQQTIEEIIKPKVIVIKNKESYAYWGKLAEKGYIWMGYEFEHIKDTPYGEVCRIKGFIKSNERVYPELAKSNLVGTIVLFSKHERALKKDEKIDAAMINQLLSLYK